MRTAPAAAALVLVAALAGCKAADALSTQEVVVHFAPNAPESAHIDVQQACGVVPHVSPQPIPSHEVASQAQTDVHFLVKPGSDKNLKRLYDCLGQPRFHGIVLGYDTPDM
ncbi:MAG: hypothetical protein ACJ735_16195 [Actinomycetes bacterium]